MTRFKDALLAELTARVDGAPGQPAPLRRRPAPRQLAAAAAVLIAIVVALGVALGPTHEQPAYAVERMPDGTIEFTLNELTDIDGANRALRDAGVRAKVQVPVDSCPAGAPLMGIRLKDRRFTDPVVTYPRPNTVAIHPDRIPADKVLFLVAVRFQGDEEITLSSGVHAASPEPCIPLYLHPSPGPSPTGGGEIIVDTSPTPGTDQGQTPTESFAPVPVPPPGG